MQARTLQLFSTNHSPQSQANTLRELLCCPPQVSAPELSYSNLFRILIVQFIDAQSFDLRSIKKTCVHIAHPDGERLIPFDTYNMFYRDDLETTRLGPLREPASNIAWQNNQRFIHAQFYRASVRSDAFQTDMNRH